MGFSSGDAGSNMLKVHTISLIELMIRSFGLIDYVFLNIDTNGMESSIFLPGRRKYFRGNFY